MAEGARDNGLPFSRCLLCERVADSGRSAHVKRHDVPGMEIGSPQPHDISHIFGQSLAYLPL
jgi:hypothetical protein